MPDFPDLERFPAPAGSVDDPAACAAWDAMTQADRDAVTQVYVNMGRAIAARITRIAHTPPMMATNFKDFEILKVVFSADI